MRSCSIIGETGNEWNGTLCLVIPTAWRRRTEYQGKGRRLNWRRVVFKASLRKWHWRKDLKKIKEKSQKISEKNGMGGRGKEIKGLGVKECMEFPNDSGEVGTWQEGWARPRWGQGENVPTKLRPQGPWQELRSLTLTEPGEPLETWRERGATGPSSLIFLK